MPLHDAKPTGPRMVDFAAEREAWNQYTLEDGTVLKVRVILTKVLLMGTDADGKPMYNLACQQLIEMEPSERAVETARQIGPAPGVKIT